LETALKRGEVYWLAFDPSVGGEIQKTRPAVIVSNDAANQALNRTLVVPLSSQTARVYPGEALVQLNGEPRKAMADQLTTASKQRFRSRLGQISSQDMERIEGAILLQLGITR
jgi:mRNA interferase MazF